MIIILIDLKVIIILKSVEIRCGDLRRGSGVSKLGNIPV
jgi:hypothetical protein